MHGQVRELCTNYGKLDMMWFDFSYDDLTGEAWRASELVRMVRSLQPDIIIDNRLEVSGSGFGSIATDEPLEYSGDYVSRSRSSRRPALRTAAAAISVGKPASR